MAACREKYVSVPSVESCFWLGLMSSMPCTGVKASDEARPLVEPDEPAGDVTGPGRPTRVETTREPSPTDDRSMGLTTGAASETS